MADAKKKRIKSKQVWKVIASELQIANYSFTAGTTSDITTAVTSLLGTAGLGGVGVTVKVSANDNDTGMVVGGQVDVLDTNNDPIASPTSGNEIYGRITEASGVYTLSLYEKVAGVETAYTAPATFSTNFSIYYAFDFKDLPRDAFTNVSSKKIQDDLKAKAGLYSETLTVTALNAVSSTTKSVSDTAKVFVYVNGQSHYSGASTPSFTITNAGVITRSTTNAGFDLETDDTVEVMYPTVQ
jgi:hypothetical protein